MVSNTFLKNSPVKVDDVTNARTIFGPNLLRLKGGSTRQKPKRVESEYIKIPRDFYRLHKFVTLTADVMFVNGIPFLMTFSRNIRLITTEHVPSRTAKSLANSLIKVMKLYARGGFVVRLALMDKEFDKITDFVGLLEVNTTAAREHVGEIERTIRFVKERTRCISNGLMFEYIPKQHYS